MPKIFFLFMMFCINPIVTNHFEVLVRDMNNQAFYKVNDGEAFCNRLMILMPGVMKCHGVTIIRINSGGSNNRSSEISADILNGDIRRAAQRGGQKQALKAGFQPHRVCDGQPKREGTVC